MPSQYADSCAAAAGVAGALQKLLHAAISSKAHGCSKAARRSCMAAVVCSMASTSLCQYSLNNARCASLVQLHSMVMSYATVADCDASAPVHFRSQR